MHREVRTDVLIFGGGVAGLWCLDRFREAGYNAWLLESAALGCGQTIQAQGIIHGGGKYALRGVRDFAAVRAIKEMPEHWRQCLTGIRKPDLRATQLIADRCYLWLPRGSALAKIQSLGFFPVLAKAGLLATPPERVELENWPAALQGSAVAVYSLAEPVISTATLMQSFCQHHRDHIRRYEDSALRFDESRVKIGELSISPQMMIFTAGAGNAELLRKAGVMEDLMQRRPLGMLLLKGDLPFLNGHCIVGGKTHLTVTTPATGIWQIGGEIAERLAQVDDPDQARRIGMREIRRWLPELDLADTQIALYRAIRAEARTAKQRRPSGVHISLVAPRIIAAWPTKLTLAPVLAEEVFQLTEREIKQRAGGDQHLSLESFPEPIVAHYPWEEVEWFNAD